MLVIASNITTRNEKVRQALITAENGPAEPAIELLGQLALHCVAAGADMLEINLQQHAATPRAMEVAVRAVQEAVDCRLCLSSDDPQVIHAGMQCCKATPILNYVSLDERTLSQVLPAAARYRAPCILLVSDPGVPRDTEEMLKRAGVLVGAANEAGITNEDIYLDPGLYHVTAEMGQRHFKEALEFLYALRDTFVPELKTACWIGNVSSGASTALRPLLEGVALAMLAAPGMSAVFMDVLRPENMRMARLVRVLQNEVIYAAGDLDPREPAQAPAAAAPRRGERTR